MTYCNTVTGADENFATVVATTGASQRVGASMELDEELEEARRHEAALLLALRAGDESVGVAAAIRLRRALLRALKVVHAAGDRSSRARRLSRYNVVTARMYELLLRWPASVIDREPYRFSLLGGTFERSFEVRDRRSHVFQLDVNGRELEEVSFYGLHVSHSRFITSMRRSRFVGSLIEASDFTYSDLGRTHWQGARVRNCYLRQTSFADASFEDTIFIDCDLRDADFTMGGLDLSTTAGAAFIRCDLRGASWSGREFSGFELMNCTLFDSWENLPSVSERVEARQQLANMRAAADRILATAPVLSSSAVAAVDAGAPTAWHREEQAWIAGRLACGSSPSLPHPRRYRRDTHPDSPLPSPTPAADRGGA